MCVCEWGEGRGEVSRVESECVSGESDVCECVSGESDG